MNLYKSKIFLYVICIAFLLVWFYMLGARTLVPTDEARYAEMAREMVVTQDWITTRLNGIKYFEKPPLQIWMNAIFFKIFGIGEWQARLWTGLCGLLGIISIGYTGYHIFNKRVGFYASLVLTSSFLWTSMGHINTLDMSLSSMLTLSICSFLLAQLNSTKYNTQRNWMLLSWIGLALAVLSKGLIGILLPGTVLILYSILFHNWTLWKKLHLFKGLVLFLMITLPWFILVSLKNPEFLNFFFIHEHIQRFSTTVHNRIGPWYYFIPILMLGIMPWTGILLQSLLYKSHQYKIFHFHYNKFNKTKLQPQKLLLIWSVFIFIFFSISNSKLPAYILPIFPTLALLIAIYLECKSSKTIIFLAISIAIFSLFALIFISYIPVKSVKNTDLVLLINSYMSWVYIAIIIIFIGSIITIYIAQRHKDLAIITLAVTTFISSQLLMFGYEPKGQYAAGIHYIQTLKTELKHNTTIYFVGCYEQALPFYLNRTITMVQDSNELTFGLKQEPHLWLPTIEKFITQWMNDRTIGKKDIAIIDPIIYANLYQRALPMRILNQDTRRIVVTNDTNNNSR